LEGRGYEFVAPYATLYGHKLRWIFAMNIRQLFHMVELRSGQEGHPGYRKASLEIHEHIRRVYPRVGKAMSFVNVKEDEALARLAAALAEEYKRAGMVLA